MYTSECVCLWCTHTHVHTHTPRYISHFSLLTSQTPPPASQPASPPAHWSVREPRGERLPTDRPSSRCCHVPEGARTLCLARCSTQAAFPKNSNGLAFPGLYRPLPALQQPTLLAFLRTPAHWTPPSLQAGTLHAHPSSSTRNLCPAAPAALANLQFPSPLAPVQKHPSTP